MDFISIDFETANQKQAPCSLGIVLVVNNTIAEEYYTLINPAQPFSKMNVSIHGITKKDVSDAPTFPEVWDQIKSLFDRYPVVAHNASFDKAVLEKTVARYRLNILPVVYYDTMSLYRHNFPNAGAYNLVSVCGALNVEINQHHNALSDARAAAQAMICLLSNDNNAIFPAFLGNHINYCDIDCDESVESSTIDSGFVFRREPELSQTTAVMDVVEEIIFDGSSFVITGVVSGYERYELAAIIEERGGKVVGSVSKNTSYVVVGLQDLTLISDTTNAKSGKILKAEKLRDEGYGVKIIDASILLVAINQ